MSGQGPGAGWAPVDPAKFARMAWINANANVAALAAQEKVPLRPLCAGCAEHDPMTCAELGEAGA